MKELLDQNKDGGEEEKTVTYRDRTQSLSLETIKDDDEEIIPGEEINHDILESKSTDFRKWGER
ncbi:hypothetical protein F2Q70_00043509 [Brassica cretica]|uniref:Uncharacterized protein n=4 Tax=Brassica TaxID=3705 RepID=A0A8S9Q261_BRACR|nr:hypothetical protein F2Q70_00043509 [Brassica cretica]KAF3516401.1 hypothetical protein DY000_02060682 [Brassica cretica]KAF3526121.1 hypothetical protein F2Q69_00048161 [Brassica cretica]VDD61370.1 unnamed protein product [Brassica oleracea]